MFRPSSIKFINLYGERPVKKKYVLYITISIIIIFLGCNNHHQSEKCEAGKRISSGAKELAQKHCSSCHLIPTPDLLDKKTWTAGVLPDMGRRLGIQSTAYDPFQDLSIEDEKMVRNLNIYPDSPLISSEEWESIIEYYASSAPDALPPQLKSSSNSNTPPPFQPNFIDIEGKEVPQVTALCFDPDEGELFIGDNDQLYALNSHGEFSSRWTLTSPAVEIKRTSDGRRSLLTIGHFKPSDLKLGVLSISDRENSDLFLPVIDQLPRPVSFAFADLDRDGQEDVLICGFGHHQGELAWYSNFQKKHILSSLPGARTAVVEDLNDDGLPDIVILMAQAWEGVDIYYNLGDGQFSKERVLEFSPVYGANYMELVDFNGDGFQDLLITNGDNWDYSPIKKPYHGITIYLNDGHNNFQESYFFPMYGCSKAIARDFDGDGDLDIAAISFYDDMDQPDKSFVYLENQGDLTFVSHYITEAAHGKWLTMDAGDFNQDGQLDLFLGSYFHNIEEWTKLLNEGITSFPEVLLLMNTNPDMR